MGCDVWDFRDQSVKDDVTIGDMYNQTKLPLLRFYFSTTEKMDQENEYSVSESDPLPQLSRPRLRKSRDILSEAVAIAGIAGPSDAAFETTTEIMETNFSSGTGPEMPAEILVESPSDTGVHESNEDELPDLSVISQSDIPNKRHIKLHRGLLMKEMIAAFKEEDIDPMKDIISMEMVMPNGMSEAAEDGGGVTRDAITEFWSTFYEECTLGNQFKIPCLRHDFAQKEWIAVAKILVYGFKSVGYFPVHLSSVFFEQCLFGCVQGNLKAAFLKYISDTDSQTIENAISDIGSVEKDELLEVLEQYEVKHLPSQANIERIVSEIAHKELIQSVMFIIDCWCPVLKCLRLSPERLRDFYDDLSPKTRRVLSILKFPDVMTNEESQVSNHLRRFVGELDATFLKRFLRFCTGSDLMIGRNIEVAFVNVIGLARRPVAHTCSCLLGLPKVYESFPQFRKEFMAILNAAVWVMDII